MVANEGLEIARGSIEASPKDAVKTPPHLMRESGVDSKEGKESALPLEGLDLMILGGQEPKSLTT